MYPMIGMLIVTMVFCLFVFKYTDLCSTHYCPLQLVAIGQYSLVLAMSETWKEHNIQHQEQHQPIAFASDLFLFCSLDSLAPIAPEHSSN